MKSNLAITSASLALTALLAAPALAAEAGKPATTTPNADAILRQMSSKLAAAKSFRFEAVRQIDPSLIPGHSLPEKSEHLRHRAAAQQAGRSRREQRRCAPVHLRRAHALAAR